MLFRRTTCLIECMILLHYNGQHVYNASVCRFDEHVGVDQLSLITIGDTVMPERAISMRCADVGWAERYFPQGKRLFAWSALLLEAELSERPSRQKHYLTERRIR
jgi:hypothetical protein